MSSDFQSPCPILLPLEEIAQGEAGYGEIASAAQEFVAALIEQGVSEAMMPDEALRADLCMNYGGGVLNGGHESGYFGNETHDAAEQSIVLDILNEIEPPVYHLIFAAALRWGDGDIAVNIDHVDTLFHEVNEQQPLDQAIGAWLIARPEVRGVPYSELPGEISRLAKRLMTASPEIDAVNVS
ncbi:MAG: hypothetical protein KTR21_06015 [Rhodobacteraceae bacterium]|nr:hypothetical protein [Paracoccaceae bacterium]